MKKILVVVDMQNDFITGPLGTPEAVSIVDKVVEKIRGEEWDRIVCTMDTHDGNYLETQEGKKLPVKHCKMYTDGWEIHEKIDAEVEKFHYTKRDTYVKHTFGSLFAAQLMVAYDSDPADYELTLVGVCTDICVISNALLLKAHYPEMKIVVDASCCAGSDPFRHREALDVMRSCQVEIVNDFDTDTK